MRLFLRMGAALCCCSLVVACFGCMTGSEGISRNGNTVCVPRDGLTAPYAPPPMAGVDDRAPTGTLTLDRAIEEALSASPELEQIRQRTDAAAEQVRQVEASFYPRVVLSEDFNTTNNPVFALMDIINQRRLQQDTNFNSPGRRQNVASQVQAEWAFFEGGSRWYGRKAAQNQKKSIQAELLAARNRLVASVSETYYRWLQALAFIDVRERALASARTNERLGDARLNAQMALPSEILRLKTQTAEARGSLLTAQTAARKMQAAMERMLARHISGTEIPDPAVLSSSLSADVRSDEPVSDTLIGKALQHRPEMESIRSVVLAADDRVRAARGELLPRLAVNSQYRWDSSDFSEAAESWMVGLQASWPLFDGGFKLSALREARSRLKESEARGKQMALDIALEVTQAALSVKEADEKTTVAREQRELARKGLDETRYQYENQVAGVDALLQAEVAWNRAEAEYMAAVFDGKITRALFRRALGDFADSTASMEPTANGGR